MKELNSFVILHVSHDVVVHEDFNPAKDAASTVSIIKDAFIRFNLELSDLRGQCYDGAANMAGCVSGVQTRIQVEQPKAMFVHCTAHSLILAI